MGTKKPVRNIDLSLIRQRLPGFPTNNQSYLVGWLGEFIYSPNSHARSAVEVEVHLFPLCTEDLEKLHRIPRKAIRFAKGERLVGRVPISWLPTIAIGAIWNTNRIVDWANFAKATFRVDIQNKHAKLLPASTSIPPWKPVSGLVTPLPGIRNLLPIREHPFHIGSSKSLVVVIDGASCETTKRLGPCRVVVPSVEILRFFFGSSGSLLSRIARPGLTAQSVVVPGSEQWSMDRSKISFTLRSRIKNASVFEAALIAFHKPALRAAQMVGRALAAAKTQAGSSEEQSIAVKTTLPFHGPVDLSVHGIWLPRSPGDKQQTFVALRIAGSSWNWPHEIEFTREDDLLPNSDQGLEPITTGPRRGIRTSKATNRGVEFNYGEDEGHTDGFPTIVPIAAREIPRPKITYLRRADESTTPPTPPRIWSDPQPSDRLGPRGKPGDPGVIPTDAVEDQGGSSNAENDLPCADLNLFRRLVDQLGEHTLQAELVVPGSCFIPISPCLGFRPSKKTSRSVAAYAFVRDDHGQRAYRRFAVARIVSCGLPTSYLIDVERAFVSDVSAMLLVWAPDGDLSELDWVVLWENFCFRRRLAFPRGRELASHLRHAALHHAPLPTDKSELTADQLGIYAKSIARRIRAALMTNGVERE